MMFREVVSEFKEALEGLVNLEKKGSGAEEGMQVAIRLLLGWTEQLRLEWAFMKGAQAASTGVAEGGDETQEGGGSCSCSKTKKRKGNRVEKDKVLIDLTSSGGPEDAEEQDDDDEKGGRRDDEEEYEMEHDDDIFGDRSSNEDEDRETIPPDDYDYEWEINASRARKRQRRSKAPGAELPDPDDGSFLTSLLTRSPSNNPFRRSRIRSRHDPRLWPPRQRRDPLLGALEIISRLCKHLGARRTPCRIL